MLSEEQTRNLIQKMFEKQDELNIHTNGEGWKDNTNLKWFRAIWTECAELLNYTNWKWWKKEDISIKDIQIEVIDILHFALSDMMTRNTIDFCITNTFFAFDNKSDPKIKFNLERIQERTEHLAMLTLKDQKFHLGAFTELCISLNMNIESLYKLYMGKNVLNRFRQDKGYKIKKYIKEWKGLEDNVYLMTILDETDIKKHNFEDIVYSSLNEKYNELVLGG